MLELPNRRWLRRGVVRAWLGVNDAEMTRLVSAGVLKAYQLNGRGRAFFSREEILRAETTGKLFKPKPEPVHA